jgi:MFS family permease
MKTRYYVGATLARAGDEMTGPAVVLLAFAITGAPAIGAVLMACLTVAAAIGGPAFGAMLDRNPRPERVLGYTLAGYAAGILVIQATMGRAPLVIAAVCALAAGTLSPAVAGGWTSQLPRVVPADELPRASALDAMSFSAASLAGPALASLTALWLGARVAVAVAAGLVGTAVPVALGLVPRRDTRSQKARITVFGEMLSGCCWCAARCSARSGWADPPGERC